MSNDESKLTIFVSSMIGPLWDERAAAEEAIRTGIPLARTWVFERAPASSEAITESYLARVRECDIYLLILDEDISDPVKAEYQTAVECARPRLCFVQEGVKRTEALEEFLPTLQADVKYATFSDEASLRREVLRAVRQELVQGYKRYRLGEAERAQLVASIAAPPPSKALSLHQLPPPPDDFTGREAELTELRAALETKGATISGLRGMGGVGKTVLALKLAQELTPRYPDAQFYLDLQGTTQPLTSGQAMAHVIRAYHPKARLPESEAELGGLYRTMLHGQRALLLMDNAAGRGQVEPLIPPAGCVLLVTSRRHFTLPGLQAVNLDAMPLSDACQLLFKIAERIGEQAEEMAELCGCLPLALRLVGSVLAERVDLSPSDYLRRLGDSQTRLGLIDGSLSLSYELLETDLQRMWAMLAVFPGTFDKEAAGAVWEMEPDPTQDGLSELVQYSLVEWNPDTARYRLHDLARLFAEARLGGEDRAAGRRRHAAHYEAVLRAADQLYKQGGESIGRGLGLFDLEWLNVQAGQRWAAEQAAEDDAAAQLCNAYPSAGLYCLNLRQHARERIRWTEAALDAARRLGDRSSEGKHLGSLGNAYRDLGQVERAIEYYEQGLEIAREIGDRRSEGAWLGNLGNAYSDLGQVVRAIGYHEEALEITQEIGDRRGEGIRLGNLGNAYRDLGQEERAVEYYEQALEIAREIGDWRNEGNWLGNLGNAYRALGQVERAIEYYEQALEIAREIGDRWSEGIHVGNLGVAYRDLGQVERAIEHYEQGLEIAREVGDRSGEGNHLGNLGNAYRDLGQVERAIEYYEQGLEIAREIGDRRGEGIRLHNVGELHKGQGNVALARQYLQQALVIFGEIKSPYAEQSRRLLAELG